MNASIAVCAGVTRTADCWLTSTVPTLADTVFVSARVELNEVVKTPLSSLVPEAGVNVFSLPVALRLTTAPASGSPASSRTLTVIAAALFPSLAGTLVAAGAMLESEAEAVLGVMVKALLVAESEPDDAVSL